MNREIVKAYFFGFKLVASDACSERKRARRHKKKRIDKKYLKRYGYKDIPLNSLFRYGDMIIGHPIVIEKIIEQGRDLVKKGGEQG